MYSSILAFHIACGSMALLTGISAISTKKGSSIHKKAGIIYYWMMYAVSASALILASIKFNPFLISISIFALYLTISGKKAIDYWRLKQNYTPVFADKIPSYAGLVTSLFMIGLPVYEIFTMGNSRLFFLAIFGSIMLINTIKDLQVFKNNPVFEPRRKDWLIKHIGMMCGAYIATTTAFLVNTMHFDPAWVLWLGPTILGGIFIAVSIIQWRKKLKI